MQSIRSFSIITDTHDAASSLPDHAVGGRRAGRDGLEARQRKSWFREGFEALILALIVTLFLRTFVLQAFEIPSVSMDPTLAPGDRLFVDKLAYSPSLAGFERLLLAKREVARGDVVVFKAPRDPARNFVKRVVALPGELVEVRGRRVFIEGQPLEEPYVSSAPELLLPESHPDYGLHGERQLEAWGPQRVPQEHFFVLGDNRDQSDDSRSWGFLRRDSIEGRALAIFWSTGAAARSSPGNRAGGPRWARAFRIVR